MHVGGVDAEEDQAGEGDYRQGSDPVFQGSGESDSTGKKQERHGADDRG